MIRPFGVCTILEVEVFRLITDWGGIPGSVCFLAIIPLEKLFEWCGEQMALYLGSVLGDLLIVTLDNSTEATLAIILLTKCE